MSAAAPLTDHSCMQEEGHKLDYEGELVIVIGKRARNVKAEDAAEYVLGWTVSNDISARHWQRKAGGNQIIIGKGFDTHCPIGPALLTADELADPNAGDGLRITTTLNGQLMQDSNTNDMIFSCGEIIEWLSTDRTLLPGTLILTGTPSGVGYARNPPVWLTAGDQICVEVDGIGKLCNTIVTTPSDMAGELVEANVLGHASTVGRGMPVSVMPFVVAAMLAACFWFRRKAK